jgi:hypothetical protein
MKPNHCSKITGLVLTFLALLFLASLSSMAQTIPTISLSLLGPGLAEISWPTNFADWRLMSTTDLGDAATWVSTGTALPLGGVMAVFYPLTNSSRFFRLQQEGSGTDFHATPATISAGGSSTLSWRTNANTTYQLFPGIGPVPGTNYVVFPAVTTTYILVASNLITDVTSNSTTVTVVSGACSWAAATKFTGTLSFNYEITPSSSTVIYGIHESANLTVNLARVSAGGNLVVFTGTIVGTATLNDSRTPLPNVQDAITVTGSDTPLAGSSANLTVDCGAGTYTFDFQPVINANWTPGGVMSTRVGSMYVSDHPLPTTYGPLASSGSLPAHSSSWTGGGDFYWPGGLGYLIFFGTVSEDSGGFATVSWSLTPSP